MKAILLKVSIAAVAGYVFIKQIEILIAICALCFAWWLAAKLSEEWKVATKQREGERLQSLRRAAATSYIRRVK